MGGGGGGGGGVSDAPSCFILQKLKLSSGLDFQSRRVGTSFYLSCFSGFCFVVVIVSL